MPDQIYSILHIGPQSDYLLIVLARENQGCLFRLVNSKGEILTEQVGFDGPQAAEKAGKEWLISLLDT